MTTEESDARWMVAVGLYPGAPQPHPTDCRCSECRAIRDGLRQEDER